MLIEYLYSSRHIARRVMIRQGGKARAKASSRAGRYPVIALHMEYTSQCGADQAADGPLDTAVNGSA